MKTFSPHKTRAPIVPMKTSGTQHFVERTYRESGQYQWIRETAVNALEAGATRILFGIEWQGVQNTQVYRRIIADNGRGMTPEELVAFFNTYGGGGKPIGGAHENFGVGAKTSLLPWNTYGLVVVSWVDGAAAMIWLERDPASGVYGLRPERVGHPDGRETLEEVYAPYFDEEHDVDWSLIKPDWIAEHGTVMVLLGRSPDEHTVLGDPDRDEADIKGISSYINRRLWEVPKGVEIVVEELRSRDRSSWPTTASMAYTVPGSGSPDRRINARTILGARHFIEYEREGFSKGELGAKGTVTLSDGTEVDWYLWEGDRPGVQSYAAISGYVAALYRDELYDVSAHHARYRAFGISEAGVRRRLWLIIRPKELGDGHHGVYPRTDRNALLLRGGVRAGEPLPFADWGAEFADLMPEPILAAIGQARGDREGTIEDEYWRERLKARFANRWRSLELVATPSGSQLLDPRRGGDSTVRRPAPTTERGHEGGHGGRAGAQKTGPQGGVQPAEAKKVAAGLPTYRYVPSEDFAPGMLAGWQPNDPRHPEGVVLINQDHPVIREQIIHWQSQYPEHLAEEVTKVVMDAYGEVAVSKVAHSEYLKSIIPTSVVEAELRSDGALTMALIGLFAEEAVIAPRLGKFRKRQSTAAA